MELLTPYLNTIGFIVIPLLFLPFLIWEYRKYQAKGKEYNFKEVKTSAKIYLGKIVSKSIYATLIYSFYTWVYQFRFADIEISLLSGIGLFFGIELCYYAMHRAGHRIRWMWSAHNVHHSARQLNLFAAIRLSWTAFPAGFFIFYSPLIILGYHPLTVSTAISLCLLYQFFLHTEEVEELHPAVEYLFNTPRNHRVHHSSDSHLLDKNFGGIIMIYDHLFGTYGVASAGEKLNFGLAGKEGSDAPIAVALGETITMFRESFNANNLKHSLLYLFGPPGWKPKENKNTQTHFPKGNF